MTATAVAAPPRRLSDLLGGIGSAVVRTGADVEIGGIAIDSREVRPGDVFFALPGQHSDGRQHVADAVRRGARAVVVPGDVRVAGAIVVASDEPARLLGLVAARFFGDPSATLSLVGVTGTNGKTTTTYLLEAIWSAAGHRPGVIGTINYRYGRTTTPAPLTTPDALTLQRLLAAMRDDGTTHVAMEVSSHALAQERVAGCHFDAAVFTNLTRDHLDFHVDIESYFAAKASLFLDHLPRSARQVPVAVVNVDDPAGARLASAVKMRCVTVGRHPKAMVHPRSLRTSLAGTHGVLEVDGRALEFESRLVGAPHVENILGAVAAAWALGIDPGAIAGGLAAAAPPPGRLEQIAGAGFTVVVDYAHSPDALARALDVLRPLTDGALITVFGCGGDRDRGKRPLMGAAAAQRSDLLVLTSDNPRTEDPDRIIADIEAGVREAGMTAAGRLVSLTRGYLVEPDRCRAIALAVATARPGDIVLIAGKGHEDYQIVGTDKRHLDDREQVHQALAGRR